MSGSHLRRKLLAGTISGTGTAFDLIAEVAAISGVRWSHASGIGLRGSIGGAAAPRTPETDGPFESPMSGRSLRWIDDGRPGALCPVAIRQWHASNVDRVGARVPLSKRCISLYGTICDWSRDGPLRARPPW